MAGLSLRKIDYDVEIFERSEVPLSSRGAGIVSHPELEVILLSLGIKDPDQLGYVAHSRKFIEADGRISIEFERKQLQFSWNKLYNSLLDLFGREKYHLAHDLVSTDQSSKGTRATFSNRETSEADILIGADGLGSRVRQQHAPDVMPGYVGYVGWRGMVDAEGLPPDVLEEIQSTFFMANPQRNQFVGYPIVTEHDGAARKCFNYVWYRPAPADTVLKDLLTDSTGKTHLMGIPPPLIRQDVIDRIKEEAGEILPRQLATIVRATTQPFLQPIYDLTSSRLVFGRDIVLGDAAFVARPHVGAGVTKAATDAQVLASCLAGESEIGEALARYQEHRLVEGQRIVEQARHLGRELEGRSRITAEELLDDTAWLAFLKKSKSGEEV